VARKLDIEYIRYYTDGSAARQPEPQAPGRSRPLPKVKKQPKKLVYIQPLAIVGILMAAVMLVMMIVGSVELAQARRDRQAMENYVQMLTHQNAEARAEYEKSLNLEEIEKSALALGMIPQSQAKQMTISVPETQAQEEIGVFRQALLFLQGMFA
jgi:cytoskeletal protein RodZ